jgi:hypothetical protein
LAAAALLALAPAATAAATSGGQPAPAAHNHNHAQPPPAEPAQPRQLEDPSQVSATTLAKELGSSGQVDPVAGLGIRNPVCDQPGQIRDRDTRLSCEADGSPTSTYPTSNYGFDVFIPTGVTHPIGDFTAAFVTILNGIWLGLIFVLKLTLELLGLAFGLNPFGDGPTMARIGAATGRIYDRLADPWLGALVVCAGIWFAHRGLLRRDLPGALGGMIAAIAMLVLGLWVVHEPRASVGRLASLSDQLALEAVSAPQSGSLERPVGTFAETMSTTWSRLVEVPFAGLDFSDVHWALSPPPKEAVERADSWYCQDIGALATIAAYERLGSEKAAEECAAFVRKRYGRPRRVIDLYLRSSPGSPARGALWDYFDNSDAYKAKVAAQGGDGALTRLSMLALFAIGLLGTLLLLAWLAIRLFTQAAIAFVLLLAAPLALCFPLLGDAGRRAFKTWGLTLLGATVAKVVYAAFLSIVLLGITIIGKVDGTAGSATGFLLSAAFAWAVFLKRTELVGWLSLMPEPHSQGLGVSGFAALALARRVSRPARAVAAATSRRGAAEVRERRALGAEATRRTASSGLRESASALADQRLADARDTVRAYEAARRGSAGKSESRRRQPQSERDSIAPTRGKRTPNRAAYIEAQELLERAERSRARGQGLPREDRERFGAEDRRLLRSSRDPADHAHRAGYRRRDFEALRGADRERAEAEIEKARERDLKRLAVATEPPGRIAGRGRLSAERLRQASGGEVAARREQLRRLRREKRQRDPLHPRRNLSRGP